MDERTETEDAGELSTLWPGRQSSSHIWSNGAYVPPYVTLPQAANIAAPYTGQSPDALYSGTYEPYQPAQLAFDDSVFQLSYTQPGLPRQSQGPFTAEEDYSSLNRDLLNNLPVVHEGFVPAPGHETDHLEIESNYAESLFPHQTDDEGDSEDDEASKTDEERLLTEMENNNDNTDEDSDFSIEDAEDEFENDPDEVLPDEELDEEDAEIEEEQHRRSRSGGRRGGRGGRGRRGRPAGRARGGLRGTFSNRGRPPKGRGPRPTADPGPEYKNLQRKANDAYLRQDYTAALEYANKAVQMNPEIFATHSLRSEIYADLGDEQKSLEALIIGAPTKRDKELWFYIIDRVKKVDPAKYPVFSNANKTALILDCLRAILQIDGDDYDARSQKLEIESRLGHISRAVKMCRRMLTLRPYDVEVLKMMARLGTSSPKHTRLHLSDLISSFDSSIAYFLEHEDPTSGSLDWSLLNIYLDLLSQNGESARGLERAKTLSRWIQLRGHETYWDGQPDDREFDIEDEPRRVAVPGFCRRPTTAEYGQTFPLEIRVKLGLFRLGLQPPDLREAMHHFKFLHPEDDGPDPMVQDYADLYRDVADALQAAGYDDEALRFYEPLYEKCFEQLSLTNLIGMYSSYEASENTHKTEALLSLLRQWNSDSLQDMAMLAKFFEDHGYDDDAMTRGEAVYRHGGGRILQKVGFQGFADIQEFFNYEKKRARGRHGVRKARVKKYMKALRSATRDEDDSAGDGADEVGKAVRVLGLDATRPKPGLFRKRKSYPNYRPKTFLPDEIPGTHVPIDAIDQLLFQRKLNTIASDFPVELKAARAQHREIIASFKRLEQLTESVESGDEVSTMEWISIARELIEEFSTFDLFYYDRRKPFAGYFRRIGAHNDLWKDSALMVLAVVANNVEDGEDEPEIQERPEKVPEEFYGVHFDKWFETFTQYAILLARRGDDERCFNTIEVASQSNIFYRSQQYYHQLQYCRLACAIALDDSMQSASAIRWFMRAYPFGSDLFRIYGLVNRLCSIPTGFATGPSMKVFLRYIKTMDYALLKRDQREWFNFRGNDHLTWMAKGAQSESVDFVKDHDPAIFTLYAHVLMCGGSYTAALNYYFRAFAVRPHDPVLNLSIGVAYIQHAMKRLSENRQFQLQQGLSFVYRYYELRTKDRVPEYCSEAEYNLGRIWHALGLTSQAITAYERCIQLSEALRALPEDKRRADIRQVDNFATEAAFSIQTIYALSGNFSGAKGVTERVLVFE